LKTRMSYTWLDRPSEASHEIVIRAVLRIISVAME
jgi:hypothetical protein